MSAHTLSTSLSTQKKTKYFVGIDPGRNTGICIYDPQRKGPLRIVRIMTLDFWSTIDLLENFEKRMSLPVSVHDTAIPFDFEENEITFQVIIEDPQLNAPTFFSKKKVIPEAVKLSKAQDVGRNKENAFLLIEYMTRKKIAFRQIKPKNSKWSDDDVRLYTKYLGPTNEHNRDAIRFVWGL
jgi:hypothetical protein